uniref:BUD13 homolog n=1 Tax=Anisakis simplex TaxID=6269 RepID=A0A0M3JIN7_ANISI
LSPRYSSRSPTSSSYKRRVYHHHTGDTDRGALNKRSNIHGPIAAGGDQIRDPWDRSRVKRGRSHELASTTLGSVLQKARRRDELRGKGSKRGHGMDSEEDGSPISSVSR